MNNTFYNIAGVFYDLHIINIKLILIFDQKRCKYMYESMLLLYPCHT